MRRITYTMKMIFGWLCFKIWMATSEYLYDNGPRWLYDFLLSWGGFYAYSMGHEHYREMRGTRELILVFGGVVPELAVQAERQGYVIKDAALEQKKANAIFLLNIHGIITDGEARKARQRLLKKIKFYEVWS